ATDQAVDDLQILEEVAEQIFAQKQRTPGWFQRKLLRERVDARLSVVARTNDLRNNSCAGVCGYLLLGLPHEASQIAYGAGMGVLPQFRGFGVGRLLVEQA